MTASSKSMLLQEHWLHVSPPFHPLNIWIILAMSPMRSEGVLFFYDPAKCVVGSIWSFITHGYSMTIGFWTFDTSINASWMWLVSLEIYWNPICLWPENLLVQWRLFNTFQFWKQFPSPQVLGFVRCVLWNCIWEIQIFPMLRPLDLYGNINILQGGTFGSCINMHVFPRGLILWVCMELYIFCSGVPLGSVWKYMYFQCGVLWKCKCLARDPWDLHENTYISKGGILWICVEIYIFYMGYP